MIHMHSAWLGCKAEMSLSVNSLHTVAVYVATWLTAIMLKCIHSYMIGILANYTHILVFQVELLLSMEWL